FLDADGPHRALHSFPTRRSSDLRVTVNGEVAELGRRVDPETDLVDVDGAPVGVRPDLVYYLLNKPAGVVTTASDPQRRPTVVERSESTRLNSSHVKISYAVFCLK